MEYIIFKMGIAMDILLPILLSVRMEFSVTHLTVTS